MRLIAHHRSFFEQKLKHVSDVKPGEVVMPSIHGLGFRSVQVHRAEANTTVIVIPDADIDRMFEDHEEARKTAASGYKAVQEGGPNHGKTVEVPPRQVPKLTRGELVARHLIGAVLPFHFPQEDLTKIEVVADHGVDPALKGDERKTALTDYEAERRSMEKFLNRRLLPEIAE